MPATRRSATKECPATLYSLSGASKPQLAALTVAALKSHLKHFKLPITGKKSVLVDRLHSHSHSSQENVSDDSLDSSMGNSQQNDQVDL